jgi:tetratricopeptide (TPR) repeat protein
LKLPPVTREDYRNRHIVSPFQTVFQNMHNQHLKSGHMPVEDQNRLYEARGYLNPDDTTAVADRLAVYNNEYVQFDLIHDYGTAFTMFSKIGSTLAPLLVRWRNEPSVMEKLGLVWSYWTVTLAENGHTAATIDKLDTLTAFVDKQSNNYPTLSQNISYVLDKTGADYLKQNRFQEAKDVYDRYGKKLADSTHMDNAYLYLYETMATSLFRKETYRKAMAWYDTALSYAKKPEDKTRIYNNIQAAYYNMSLNEPQAKKLLRECVEKYPMCSKCRKQLNSIP